ncbi:hypothetical protein [Streptomyces sp. NPDC051183]|uniref:hypothetical protein n=1 Tax=Streptomyces sp. NPDC051183 TaxID=3155165 RepID=UPI003445B573
MNHLPARYGASPLHLALTLCSFVLALYAGLRLLEGDTWGVAVWFVGAALLHDLVLLPLYSAADRGLQRLLPPSDPAAAGGRTALGVNYVRVPAFVSGLLLLVWWPLILGRVDQFTAVSALPADVFLGRWLLITAALFAGSVLWALIRTAQATRRLRAVRRAQRPAARKDTK